MANAAQLTLLTKIEIYVCLSALVLGLVVIMGSMRRTFGYHRLFRMCLWIAYTISYGLVFYTMGLMTAASFHSHFFAIWSVFLLVFLGRADSLIAYRHVDFERSGVVYKMALQMFWAGWLILYIHEPKFQLSLWCLWLIGAVRIYERLISGQHVKKTLRSERGVKLVVDFMNHKHEQMDFDPESMKGCHYLVSEKGVEDKEEINLRVNMEKVVTIEKIWQCKGLLSQERDSDNLLKDICLSFALFKLLLRRFSGFSLHEASYENSRKFVLDGLLREQEGHDRYKRVRNIIEVELGFLYEFFYTKYPVIFSGGFPVYKVVELLLVFVASCSALSILGHYPTSNLKLFAFNVDVNIFVTRVMIFMILIMELFQFIRNLLCNWHKVQFLVNYVRKNKYSSQHCAFMGWMMLWVCKLTAPAAGHFVTRYMSQYSFLESFDYDPPFIILNNFLSKFTNVPKGGQRMVRIKHPDEVSKKIIGFIANVLSNHHPKLTNGTGSLLKNSRREGGDLDHELVLKLLGHHCEFETHSMGIMVWHIATCLCEYECTKRQNPRDKNLGENFNVANCLSRYFAYLVAIAPKLLPDSAEVGKITFHRTVKQARKILEKGKPMEVKYEEMMRENFAESAGTKNIVKRGAELGRLLIMSTVTDRTLLWKVLAEFWVEKSVFLAPSNLATAHAEYLTKGGELITCIWALLDNAGIVEPNTPMANRQEEEEVEIMQEEEEVEIILR